MDISADRPEVRPLTGDESARLHAALDPILRDVRVTGAIMPDIREETREGELAPASRPGSAR